MGPSVDTSIFKAYDVRGIYPSQIDEGVARAIGAAFVDYLRATRIAVGRDMRLSSPALAAAFIDGATSRGADVVDSGAPITVPGIDAPLKRCKPEDLDWVIVRENSEGEY